VDQGLLKVVSLLWIFSVGASILAAARKLSRVAVTRSKDDQARRQGNEG